MHSETHPVRFEGGVHNGTLAALRGLGQFGFQIHGVNPAEEHQWEAVLGQLKTPDAQVTLAADSGDHQMDRDMVAIGRHTIWAGTSMWPGKELGHDIPPERFNMAANVLRIREGLEQEGPNQVDSARVKRGAVFSSAADTLKGEGMDTRTAQWSVTALGELQQPSGVGATQDYNEVVDGPNPDGPNFGDNAGNSYEQEVALQTWVNMAIDMLNRGEPEEAVMAQLAHDGCPDPQAALQRAMQQPNEPPVTDSIGQDPFEAPPADDPLSTSMESVSRQPPALGKVRIAGTDLVGTVQERYEDTWGRGVVRVALDDGGTLNVAPEALQDAAEPAPKRNLTEIQTFIDSMPEVQPTRPHIEARLANLALVKTACRNSLREASISDQVELDRIFVAADEEEISLRRFLRSEDYLAAMPGTTDMLKRANDNGYRVNRFEIAPPTTDRLFTGSVREAAAIWVAESSWTDGHEDVGGFQDEALHYCVARNMTGDQVNEFLHYAHQCVARKQPKVTEKVAATVDNDGPAEALFV